MQKSTHIGTILRGGGFAFQYLIGRFLKVGFCGQCCLLALIAALGILAASFSDGSLFLKERNVGLLQHPAIWCFLGLQIALPLSIAYSLKKLIRSRSNIRMIIKLDGRFSDLIIKPILYFIRLENTESRSVATLIYCAGLTAFIWNTYQNQHPDVVVPYDFWDSKTYFWGFWVTRIYKLYLFVWLLPYIALIHIAILTVTLGLIRRARIQGQLKIMPFHPDGVGGLGFVPGIITAPIVLTLLISSIPTAAAFEVHRRADVTPLMGAAILAISAGIAYIIPILFLRSDIIASKQEIIGRLRSLEQSYYSRIINGQDVDFETLKKGSEALDYFDKVCGKIQLISNYPHLKHFGRYVGLALTPSAISLTLKLYEQISSLIHPLSKKP